jgi:hypothetical protein
MIEICPAADIRNDEREPSGDGEGYFAMRATTRERMISIMAEAGMAGWKSANRRITPLRRFSTLLAIALTIPQKAEGKAHACAIAC